MGTNRMRFRDRDRQGSPAVLRVRVGTGLIGQDQPYQGIASHYNKSNSQSRSAETLEC